MTLMSFKYENHCPRVIDMGQLEGICLRCLEGRKNMTWCRMDVGQRRQRLDRFE